MSQIDGLVDQLGRIEALDRSAERFQTAVSKAIRNGGSIKDALAGRWLRHPLHPLLTDLVIGSWVSAGVLDALSGRTRRSAAADLVGIGLVVSVPTALSGLSDWSDVEGRSRRIGFVHGVGNLTAAGCQLCSWCLRRRDRHAAGVAFSALGLSIAGCSAWLGGHLSYREGVGVDQTVFEEPPTSWTSLIDDEKLDEGALVRRSANGTGVLLVRHGGKVFALVDRCSHRGCSLSGGTLDGPAVTCPCHGSTFGLDGRVIRGPAVASQPRLETRTRDGRIEVRAWPD